MRHDASGADNRVVADGDAREDDGAATDPDVTPDPDGSAAFEPLAPLCQIARMIGRSVSGANATLSSRSPPIAEGR
jgi:hypothetical protein